MINKQKKELEFKAMEKLLADNPEIVYIPQAGDTIKGVIIGIHKNIVYLDINGLSTGIVRGKELYDESGEYSDLKINDEVEATVLEVENENGEMELSFQNAGHQKAWNNLEELHKDKKVIAIKVVSANKGGLMAKYGKITGFLPVSQLSIEHYPRVEGGDKNKILEKLNRLITQNIKVKILDLDEAEEKLIFSEKIAWEEAKRSTIAKYSVGSVIEGSISGVVNFGAFIEFGDGLEGLVHISELAWQRIDNPSDIVKVGDKVKAEIISIDGSKISLSIKKLLTDPWENVAVKYKIGSTVKGTVLKINPFGLFVELDKDIHGLAHVSELSEKGDQKPFDIAKINDVLDFTILSIEAENHRLGLSLKKHKPKKDVEKPKVEKTAKDITEKKVEGKKKEITEKEVAEKIKE